MLGELTRKDQTNGGLDFPRGDGGLLVVGSKLGGLSGDALEDVYGPLVTRSEAVTRSMKTHERTVDE